jgi:anaerobic carbon-monoxide dehydrogenase iron sulfur subunit
MEKIMPTLVVQDKPCIGCRLCEQWCTWHHHAAVNPALARLHIHRLHEHYVNEVTLCIQCAEPACVAACPQEALQRDPATGGLILNAGDCILCGSCALECVTGVLRLHPDSQLPLACDLCGGDPQCVRHCPEGVLAFLDNVPETGRLAKPVFSDFAWRGQ